VAYPDSTSALYQLDAVGNRVGERKAPSSAVASIASPTAFIDVATSALTSDVLAVFNRVDWLQSVSDSVQPSKDTTFTWDAAGNLTQQTTSARDRHFDWDVKQTLTAVTDDGVEVGRYDYGADGLRTKRVTALESVEYVLDGDEVLVEADGATVGHPARRRYHYAAKPLAVAQVGSVAQALHLDALGSPTTVSGAGGAVTAVRQYDAFGQYRNGTAPTAGEAKLGFTGHSRASCTRGRGTTTRTWGGSCRETRWRGASTTRRVCIGTRMPG